MSLCRLATLSGCIHLAPILGLPTSAQSQLRRQLSVLCPPLTKIPILNPAIFNEGTGAWYAAGIQSPQFSQIGHWVPQTVTHANCHNH